MNENQYPSIKYLQQLLNMTEKFPYTIKEVNSLKSYMKVVNAWLKSAETLLLRDKRNVNKENLKPRSLQQIRTLIDRAEVYAFESQEIKSLKSLYESVLNFQMDVSSFLNNSPDQVSLDEVKEFVRKGRDLDVDLPEMQKLELLYENLIWRRESESVMVDGEIEADYKTVNHLIEMAKECNIPSDHPIFINLCHEKEKAENWKERAEKLIAQDEIDMKDLESLLDEINDIPNIEGLMEDLNNMQVKAEDYIEMAKMYLDDNDLNNDLNYENNNNNNNNDNINSNNINGNNGEEGKEKENHKELGKDQISSFEIRKEIKEEINNNNNNNNNNNGDNNNENSNNNNNNQNNDDENKAKLEKEVIVKKKFQKKQVLSRKILIKRNRKKGRK